MEVRPPTPVYGWAFAGASTRRSRTANLLKRFYTLYVNRSALFNGLGPTRPMFSQQSLGKAVRCWWVFISIRRLAKLAVKPFRNLMATSGNMQLVALAAAAAAAPGAAPGAAVPVPGQRDFDQP